MLSNFRRKLNIPHHSKMHFYAIFASTFVTTFVIAEDIQVSKLFILPITPAIFNWKIDGNQFEKKYLYEKSVLHLFKILSDFSL